MTFSVARLGALVALCLFSFAGNLSAKSDGFYQFTDAEGVPNLSNLKYLDTRYERAFPGKGALVGGRAPGPVRAEVMARFQPFIDEASRSTGVDARLLHAVMHVESGYNPRALSNKGARGLMQLLPMTGKRYGVRDIDDPRENILGGARYLRDLLKMFGNNVELALAGYNAGENAVIRAGNRIPRYQETMAYVPKVLSLYKK